jgi:glutathione synthase/RimK-type ligase-like ATP-grasp enzyme
MVTVGVHSQDEGFSARWIEFLERSGASVKRLNLLGPDPLDQVRGCDGVMWHWEHYPYDRRFAARPILLVVEKELGIPVFPDFRTAWHFDDKIAQAYLFSALEIPSPKTWVFWDRDQAEQWTRTAAYPVVAKLATGAGSTNVRLLRNQDQARAHIRAMFSRSGIIVPSLDAGRPTIRTVAKTIAKRVIGGAAFMIFGRYPALPKQNWMPHKNYALFQEFLAGNSFDTRITVIGDRAFGFRRMNRPDDFRASGSGVIDHDSAGIDLRCVEQAFRAAERLKAQSVAFDFLYAGPERTPMVVEISYGYANWAIEKCSGHWDRRMTWHEGHMWPEEAHVQDFLKLIESAKSEE